MDDQKQVSHNRFDIEMNVKKTIDEKRIRLSLFGQRLQSLSDSFYSTILEDSNSKDKEIIKSSDQLKQCQFNDFTFDQCSFDELSTKDNFSFTFHSVDQSNSITNISHSTAHQISKISKTKSTNSNVKLSHCSTPNRKEEKIFKKKDEDQETILVEENRRIEPVVIGYYPVISYQPVSLPPPIFLSNEQIQQQIHHRSNPRH